MAEPITSGQLPVKLDYTARDFVKAKADLEAFVTATRGALLNDFFESSLGSALIDLAAYIIDLNSYGQDIMAQELFLSTARRLESALRFCRSVGYVPRSSVAARVLLKATALPPAVTAQGAVIEAGTSVPGINGLSYEVVEQTIIPSGATTFQCFAYEGASYTQTYTPSRAARQQMTTDAGVVENNSWKLYVGDPTVPSNLWEAVSNVSLETAPTKTYEVAFDGDGRLIITWGDGNAGKIPDATVTLIYRRCNGEDGNSSVGTIKGSLRATLIGTLSSVSLAVENADSPATGGRNRETVAELRVNVPSYIRTLDKLITLRDYQESMKRITGVALGYADVPLASYSGNIVRCYAWDRENVDFTAISASNGLSSTVGYNKYAQIPSTRIQDIQRFLSPRTILTVHNIVLRPTMANVDLFLGTIKYNRLYKQTDVHRGVVEAVVALFEQSTGFAIYIAEIYERVLQVPGVRGFQIEKIIFEHLNPADPMVTLTDDMRSDQDPTGANGGPFLAIKDLTTPGAVPTQFYDASYLYNGEIRYEGEVDASAVQAINLRSLTFNLQS